MTTPNQRSKELLEAEGFVVGLVERYNSWSQTRHDLFGFIDLIAVRAGEIVAIQSTSDTNLSHRRKKLETCDAVPICIAAGMRVEIHGWKIRARRWSCRRVEYKL